MHVCQARPALLALQRPQASFMGQRLQSTPARQGEPLLLGYESRNTVATWRSQQGSDSVTCTRSKRSACLLSLYAAVG